MAETRKLAAILVSDVAGYSRLAGADWRRGRQSALPSRGSSHIVLHAALVTYFKLLSRAAHAWGTPESAALLPGITAQPPFST